MTSEEASALRQSVERALNPLYQARTGTIAPMAAVAQAIEALHAIDRDLLVGIRGGLAEMANAKRAEVGIGGGE